MHISGIALECSRCCAQLALKCSNEEIAVELNVLAVQLMTAAVRDAELLLRNHSLGGRSTPSPATAFSAVNPHDLTHSRASGLMDMNTLPQESH